MDAECAENDLECKRRQNLGWTRYRLQKIRETPDTPKYTLLNSEEIANIARKDIGSRDRECFARYDVNTKNRLIGRELVSLGTLDCAVVSPRETFKGAIVDGASSIIIAHNHPSGDPTPSVADLAILKKMRDVGDLLGIKLLDFIITTKTKHWSASEEGKL